MKLIFIERPKIIKQIKKSIFLLLRLESLHIKEKKLRQNY